MNNEEKGGEEKHYMKDPTCPFLSHKLPPDLNEVAYVIAKVYKYGNIDDYAEKLIREDIERRRNSDDTEDSFKKYIDSVLLLSLSPSTNNDDDDDKNDEIEKIDVTLRLKKDVAQVGRLIAKHNNEDFDNLISEEVSKIIYSLSESSSTILTPPPISDELKQHIQKLLLEEEGGKEK
jgi:hypothetical protein